MKKRIASFAMALLMILSILPSAAFATGTVSFTVGTATVEPGKTATVDVSIAGASSAALMAVYLEVDFDSALTLSSVNLSDAATQAGFKFGQNNLSQGIIQLDGDSAGSNINDGVLFTLEFVTSEKASGTYTVSINYLDDTAENVNDGNTEVPCTFTAGSITVGADETTTDSYTAEITTTADEFKIDDTVAVTVNVGGTTGEFASSELTLTYDSTYLTFDKDASTLNGAGVTETAGTIKLVDHGETNAYPAAYVLNFTAKAATNGAVELVKLVDAKFSTAENAISSNLINATGENALSLTITEADLDVTLPNNGVVTGNNTVPYGDAYTFTAKNNTTYMYYDYEVSATMGGVAVPNANIVDNGDGTWTIENVTGDLVISVRETPKTYSVTVNGDNTVTAEDIAKVVTSAVENKATYNTALTYTLPAGEEATETEDGYHYTATVTIGDVPYTASANGQTYTIAGAAVTGDIVITLSKVVDSAYSVTVKIEGSNEIQKEGQTVTEFTANKNSAVTLTLVPEVGYTYVINDGTNNLTINDDNTFTVNVDETALTITVTKTLDTDSVNVQKYLTLNGTNMWLVTINGNVTEQISGKTYTYSGTNMYWSGKYQAYCYLVVAENLDAAAAKTMIGNTLVEANAIDVEYNMDVNNTNGNVDANDAQLVYNMYQTKAYDNFTSVDMLKFLEADLNDTVGVNSTDAQVIINAILNTAN